MNSQQILSEFESKDQEIRDFIGLKTEKVVQRSPQWFKARSMSFGGSETADLMRLCKNNAKSYQRFLKDKANPPVINPYSRRIMDWGILFEPVHREVLGYMFNTDIHEAGLIKGTGLFQGSHQSPDGLAVVSAQAFKDHVQGARDLDITSETVKVLFELKSPYKRRIEQGVMPEKYVGQVKLGLALFTLCDFGLYSESKFRLCTEGQWTTPHFNFLVIKDFAAVPDPEPLYIGYCILPPGILPSGDNGLMDGEAFDALIGKEYQPVVYQYSDLESAKKHLQELRCSGRSYFCWKLVNMQHIAVERSSGFERVLQAFVAIARAPVESERDIERIETFSRAIRQKEFPLMPLNAQDRWMERNKEYFIRALLDSAAPTDQFNTLVSVCMKDLGLSRPLIRQLQKKYKKLLSDIY